jgi:glutamate 5-kinase
MTESEKAARIRLQNARRVVVKVGTRLLADKNGKPAESRIVSLVDGICELRSRGTEVVLVSSGAIGMGINVLGLKKRPTSLPELQMAAAVGQSKLMSYYGEHFDRHGVVVGQVLLTHDLLNHRTRHLNARNTLLTLLRHGIVPVVNENDAVAVDEIRVGDNDSLGALTSLLVDADVLVLLTTVSGFQKPDASGRPRRVSHIARISVKDKSFAGGTVSGVSVGGMRTKLDAAESIAAAGALTVIADGRKAGILNSIFSGTRVGTVIGGGEGNEVRNSRKRWIAFFHRSSGTLVVDEGARVALEQRGKSLLAIGVKRVRGTFEAGSLVNIESPEGALIARGLIDYSSADVAKIRGKSSGEILSILGRKDYNELIHRDNMVVLSQNGETR